MKSISIICVENHGCGRLFAIFVDAKVVSQGLNRQAGSGFAMGRWKFFGDLFRLISEVCAILFRDATYAILDLTLLFSIL